MIRRLLPAVLLLAGGIMLPPAPAAVAGPHKIMVIPEENHSRAEALAGMPYLTSLGNTYGQATSYDAITHPSLPNYLAIWGGSTFGITTDCGAGTSGCVPSPPSIWGQTLAAGGTAKAYSEDMTSDCQAADAGNYTARHVPWPYWTDTAESGYCNSDDVPMGTTASGSLLNDINSGSLPVTGEMIPNLCNDAHNCSLSTADAWLQSWIPVLMGGPDYKAGNLTIIITFDEDDSTAGNNVMFVVIDPRLSGVSVTGTGYNHYSLARWLDDNAGVSELRNAATAPDLRAAFGLAGSTSGTCTGVQVAPGQDVQAAVNNNPSGTTFCFAAGTYANVSSLVPKDGDIFDGQAQAAILDGQNAAQYAFYADGANPGPSGVTVKGFKIQNYATPLQKGAVQAFNGANWTIQGNDIEHNGAAAVATGSGAQVLSNTLSNNYQEGYTAHGSNVLYQGNTINGNNAALNPCNTQCSGQIADWEAGGGKAWMTSNFTFKNNTVNGNGGPAVWFDTSNINTTVDGNTADCNYGAGIYEEISYNFTITNNDVERNGGGDACAPGGGQKKSGFGWDSGIQLRGSQGCVSQCTTGANGVNPNGYGPAMVTGNKLVDNYNGISVLDSPDQAQASFGGAVSDCQDNGSEGYYGICLPLNITIKGNGVSTATNTLTGGWDDGSAGHIWASGTDHWDGNAYCEATTWSGAGSYGGIYAFNWGWVFPPDPLPSWQAGRGFYPSPTNDVNGTFTVTDTPCAVPGGTVQQPPAVTTGAASKVTKSSAVLNGTVSPEGAATTYHFQYGTTASYGSTVPVPDGQAGSGTTAVAVSAQVTGLAKNTTYHYRLAASNSAGTSYGADVTFKTPSHLRRGVSLT